MTVQNSVLPQVLCSTRGERKKQFLYSFQNCWTADGFSNFRAALLVAITRDSLGIAITDCYWDWQVISVLKYVCGLNVWSMLPVSYCPLFWLFPWIVVFACFISFPFVTLSWIIVQFLPTNKLPFQKKKKKKEQPIAVVPTSWVVKVLRSFINLLWYSLVLFFSQLILYFFIFFPAIYDVCVDLV